MTWDFLVVGSGFGGSVAALRLAEKGYSVHMLEAGRRFEDEDFARLGYPKGFVGPQGLGSEVTIFADPATSAWG